MINAPAPKKKPFFADSTVFGAYFMGFRRPTSIVRTGGNNFRFRNENGLVADGTLLADNTTLVIPAWNNLIGKLANSGNFIIWQNGTWWRISEPAYSLRPGGARSWSRGVHKMKCGNRGLVSFEVSGNGNDDELGAWNEKGLFAGGFILNDREIMIDWPSEPDHYLTATVVADGAAILWHNGTWWSTPTWAGNIGKKNKSSIEL